MKNIKKKTVLQYLVMGSIFLVLFFTGTGKEAFAFIQKGILKTGIVNPEVKQEQNPGTEADYQARFINSKGEKVNMEQYKGKVIFMNIWATWCPPCIAEMPGINELYNKVKEEDIIFLMLSVDDDFEKAKRFKKKKGFDFEILMLDGPFPEMYYTQSIPTTFVINAGGELALAHMGMADYDTADFKDFLLNLK